MKLLGWLVLVGCSHAVPVQHSQQPTTPPSLAFYVGHWACDGTSYKPDGSVEKAWDGLEVDVRPEYTSWLRLQVLDHQKVVTSEFKGVDEKGAFHHIWTADDGTYGSLTSAGWTGNRLVFDDDHPGTDKTRMTFTKIDDTHYSHEAEVDHGSGYQREFVKACHKVS
ncbi:MAG TPA: hypothetical protein VGC41_29535 [Kofleriaceae bacterium]